ncbi:MAG TPA: hypothetical protein VK867_09365, partial [Candidatus Limnocylindrales bacterium]|nr:hypothetical protein [Candidatus Limnocylindrales bacterium]
TSAPYQVGRYGMYEILDAAAIGRAIRARRRPEGPVVKPWLVGDKALFWWSDPMPALGGVGHGVARRIGRVVERVRGLGRPSVAGREASNRVVSTR